MPELDDVKVCPECGSEFQLHMTNCLDCGTALVLPGELPDEDDENYDGEDLGDEGDEPERVAPAVEGQEGVMLRSTDWQWARELAADLEEAGIPSHVSSVSAPGAPLRAAVWVRPEDEAAARAVDRRRYQREIPPVEGEAEEDEPAPVRRKAAPAAPASDDVRVCSRCGAEYQLWVERCLDCDLPLGTAADDEIEEGDLDDNEAPATPALDGADAGEAPACPACGEPLAAGAVECPECGLAFAVTEISCAWCGTANDFQAESCTRCGTPLQEA